MLSPAVCVEMCVGRVDLRPNSHFYYFVHEFITSKRIVLFFLGVPSFCSG